MKTLANLNVPKDTSPEFPFGTIQNETDTQEGTPVVRELYGDILTNLWKLLEITGEIPTGTEDSDNTQYQIINALKKFSNELNDIEQILTLNVAQWVVPFSFELLPNKYVFTARASEKYISGTVYTFKGAGATVYNFTSPTGFSASDELLIIIDSATVRAYSLTALNGVTNVFNVLGAPLSFNASNDMYYLSDGQLYSDTPSIHQLQAAIIASTGTPTYQLIDVVILKGYAMCLVYESATLTYNLFTFSLLDLNTVINITITGAPGVGTDEEVYMFSDGVDLFFTNDFNNSANDYSISKYSYTVGTQTVAFVSSINIDNSFLKTTNGFVRTNKLITFVDKDLASFNLATGAKTVLLTNYQLTLGVLFSFNGKSYYTNDEVASEWNF